MKNWHFVFVIFLLTNACKSNSTIQNNLHTTTLSEPDKSTTTYYSSKYNYNNHFKNAPGSGGINAVAAWDYIRYYITSNTPGFGMKVLVADSAIASDHTAFYNNGTNKVSQIHLMNPYSTNTNFTELSGYTATQNARNGSGNLSDELTAVSSHGTGVTSLIVGNQVSGGGTYYSGVAFGATAGLVQLAQKKDGIAWNTDAGENLDGSVYLYGSQTRLSDLIRTNGYNIVNMSFGGGYWAAESSSISYAVKSNNVLFVIATGNNNSGSYANPEYPAVLAATLNTSENTGGILAVASTNATTHNSSTETFNYCGSAKAFCLVAPSTEITMASSNTTTSYVANSGTSFSTPLVSGAAAVLGGAFPSLTMANIRDFLLRGASPYYDTHASGTDPTTGRRTQGGYYITSESQRKTSADGLISDVYGYGKLDLLETVKLVNSTVVKNTTASVKDTSIYASPIFYSAMQKPENIAALNTVTSHDAYGEYTVGLGNNVKSLSTFGMPDKISLMVRMNAAANSRAVNMPFGSVFVSNFIKPKELSYTNGDFMQMQATSGFDGQINRSTFHLTHNFAGMNFSFTEGFAPQNFAIVQDAHSFNPFYAVAFGMDSRKFAVRKNFGSFAFGVESVMGKPQIASGRQDLFGRRENNLTQTFSLSHNKNGNMIGFDTGFLRESQTLLGTYSSGAFALGSNNTTAFVKTNFSQKIYGNTSLIGSVSFGRTTANQVQNSLFTNVTPLLSRSFIVGLKQDILGGSFAVTYSQPLAIISGKAYFEGANGMQTISLTPSAQEQDFGISFSKQGKKSRTSLQAAYILNQNNLNVKPTVGLFATWTREVK